MLHQGHLLRFHVAEKGKKRTHFLNSKLLLLDRSSFFFFFFCYNVGPRGPGNPGAQSDQLGMTLHD